MIKQLIEKRRMAKAQSLLDQLNNPQMDSVEALLCGERGGVMRKLRGLYVECRKLFMNRAFKGAEARNLANAIYYYLADPFIPLGATNAVQAGFPPWATQADLAEALLAEAERRGFLDSVMAEFAALSTEMETANV